MIYVYASPKRVSVALFLLSKVHGLTDLRANSESSAAPLAPLLFLIMHLTLEGFKEQIGYLP